MSEEDAREAAEEIAHLHKRLTRLEVMSALTLAVGVAVAVRVFAI